MFKKRTVQPQDVLDYCVRREAEYFEETGKKGVYPSADQIAMVFGITKNAAEFVFNSIRRHLEEEEDPIKRINKTFNFKSRF